VQKEKIKHFFVAFGAEQVKRVDKEQRAIHCGKKGDLSFLFAHIHI